MAQDNIEGGNQSNLVMNRQVKYTVLDFPGTATAKVLTNLFPPVIVMDPATGAVNVDLPIEEVGLTFIITNKAAATGTLVIRRTGGGATVETIPATCTALIICISTVAAAGSWRSLLGAAT